jgi:hypothetical protein
MLKAESLKPQDILVACKLYSLEEGAVDYTYASLGRDVGLSPSEAHSSAERCRRAALLTPNNVLLRRNLRDLLVVAVPRVYYATRGGLADGTPTSVHAPVLLGKVALAQPTIVPVVWPGAGRDRGESLSPIYSTVPVACRADPLLYELMALVDVLRVGAASERAAATELLDKMMACRRGKVAASGREA